MSSHLRRPNVVLAVLFCLALPVAAQQLEGRFYAEKDKYMLGEPILFNVEIKNIGAEVVYVNAKGPGKCLDRYDFLITGPSSGCGQEWVPSCQDDTEALKPGEFIHGQWELDSWYRFEREGKYSVQATRHVPIESTRGESQDFTFSSKFEVKIEDPDPVRVQSILQDFERNLHSADPEVRHSALDVMSTTAPDYFESTALRLSRDKDPFVVLHAAAGLAKMNTPETRAALADILTSREANNRDEITARLRALEGLGWSGDEAYEGLVARYLDDRNEHVQRMAMTALVEIGKTAVVPQVQRYFFNSNPVVRKNAAAALRFSTTPDAIEALIEALGDKDVSVREEVLTSLTRMVGNAADSTGSPQQVQEHWRRWWRTNKSKVSLPDHFEFFCQMK